jgi:hypothetical protein
MKNKEIAHIIPAQKVNMGGHILDQPLPVGGLDYVDPFLLIHHWKSELPGDQHQRDVGVGPHPHRGFSPVTFIFKGSVQHRDSMGENAIVYEGGTQWMHAGRGVTHSERPDAEIAKSGGELEFIQFWVNSPAKHKMDTAFYLPLSDEQTPRVTGDGYHIAVVAGEYAGVKGAAPTLSPMTLLRGEVKKDMQLNIDLPADFNTLFYLLDGSLKLNGQKVKAKDMVHFKLGDERIEIQASADTRFMILSGAPLNEPVATYGPFVMNDQSQVMEALRDAQMGKMGVLIEEF